MTDSQKKEPEQVPEVPEIVWPKPNEEGFVDFDEDFGYDKRPAPKFILGGHQFTCKQVVPYRAWRLTDKLTGLDFSIAFLKECLLPEEVDKLDAIIESPTIVITGHQIDKVVRWLIKEHAGRPTESSSSSGNGDGRTSDGLTGNLPEKESITAS